MSRRDGGIVIVFTSSKIHAVLKCHISIDFLLTCAGIFFINVLNVKHTHEIGIAGILFKNLFLFSGTNKVGSYSINDFLPDL